MELLLNYFILFLIGSIFGFILEVLYRRFFSAKHWINPGFLSGPWQPLYGVGLVILYIIANLGINIYYEILLVFVFMTLIEYLTGLFFIKLLKVKLWDYSNKKFNIQGIVSLQFSIYWLLIGMFYIYLINPSLVKFINLINYNYLIITFILGGLFVTLLIDFLHSMNIVAKLKKLYETTKTSTNYNQFKLYIKTKNKKIFLLPIKLKDTISDNIQEFANKIKETLKK